jgi:lysophospholipase L1-like esterase
MFRKRLFSIFILIAMLICIMQTSVSAAAPIKIACIGDSITNGNGTSDPNKWAYPMQLGRIIGSDYTVSKFGVSGSTILKKGDLPYWNQTAFTDSQNFLPDMVIIQFGSNDCKSQNWQYSSEFISDYTEMINIYKNLVSHPRVFISLPPTVYTDDPTQAWGITNSVLLNQVIPQIRQVAVNTGCTLIDNNTITQNMSAYFPDRVHPNNDGAAILANNVYTKILENTTGIMRPIYTEDLSDSLAQNWTPVSGTWAVESNEYSGNNVSANGIAYYNAANYSNFTYKLTSRYIGSSTGETDVIFRYQDTNNYYQAYVSKASGYQYLKLYKIVGGVVSQIGSQVDYNPLVDTELNWTIVCNGSNISATLSNNTVSAIDSTFITGKIGVKSNMANVHFDNMAVGYSEDISDGVVQNWVTSGGTWAVESEEYSGSNSGISYYNETNFGSFTYTLTSKYIGASTGETDMIFKYQNAANYYQAYISKANGYQYLRLYKIVNGTATQIGNQIAFNPPVDTDLNWTIICTGNTITASINGYTIAAIDSTFALGKIGVKVNQAHIHFTKFRLS